MPVKDISLFQQFPTEALVKVLNHTSEPVVIGSKRNLDPARPDTSGNLQTSHVGGEVGPQEERWVLKRDYDAIESLFWQDTGNLEVTDIFQPETVTVDNLGVDPTALDDRHPRGVLIEGGGEKRISEDVWDNVAEAHDLDDTTRDPYVDPNATSYVDNTSGVDIVLTQIGRHRGAGLRIPAGAIQFPVPTAVLNDPQNNGGHAEGVTLSIPLAAHNPLAASRQDLPRGLVLSEPQEPQGGLVTAVDPGPELAEVSVEDQPEIQIVEG